MTRRGRRPRRWRGLVRLFSVLGALAALVSACGSPGGGSTTVTYVGVSGGAISFGMTGSPTGCNPNTPSGDTTATQTVLAGVLPSPYVVQANGTLMANSNLIASAEPLSLNPLTVVYTLNPKAVWSDGVPITADDFKYAWEQQRGNPDGTSTDVVSVAGYRDVASVQGTDGGHTVTVKFKTAFADWQSLFANLLPAHVMERVGWNPSCSTVSPSIDLSGGPFEIASVSGSAIKLVQNPKWWGAPANAKSITVHLASSTAQLTSWMDSGYVQVALPTTVTPSFLTAMTGLPGAQSDVDMSNTLLQLDMASSLDAPLSPDLRTAIALSINRQQLLDQQVGWAVPGIAVANSHVYVQGQQGYKPAPNGTVPTTTIPVPTSSTSTTVIGAGGSVNFPVTTVPTQAAAFVQAAGLVKTPDSPYYHSAFGVPFTLHMVVDESDPWAASAAPTIRADLLAAGLNTDIETASSETAAGEALADGYADLALVPVTFSPYLSQTLAWYTTLLGMPGKNGSEDWTAYDNTPFEQLVTMASQQLNADTAASIYQQADTQLWDQMVSLPLYAEPAALAWSRSVGGVVQEPRSTSLLWFAQYWAVRQAESTSNTTPSLPGQ
ncbi:MAG TPA: ABC transporter substrate-binding protein [Acidimicrobiales bacterium]|nr:ABC transporter substrate-binding protein [Acidimicrobiales bacterium]